ncbi:MAG: hypothetical protein C0469_09755 [Cyanobacteria bacterium DS2.3.42]|nr:hypothetical protein [Cyanobacteria bacterium DS2.3.42]
MDIGNSSKCADDALVQKLYIAAPCDVGWDTMEGDERTRFCGQCKLNVYNIAEMSTKEAATLIRGNEGRLCLRLYKRKDGTIITDNCPVGLRKIRDRMKRCAAAVIMSFAWVGLLSSAQAQGLVGAPVDPRYGVSGEVGTFADVETSRSFYLTTATWVSCILLCLMTWLKRGRLPLLGSMLLCVWALAGVAYGISCRP